MAMAIKLFFISTPPRDSNSFIEARDFPMLQLNILITV
jgi:hypothetical protein